jgi:TRAP-type C4-dicarboxylate transport system substrate-binding protein
MGEKHMSKLTNFLASTALAVTAATSAFAAETVTISNWLPPSHPVVTGMFTQLSEMMAEATNGEVTTEIKNGLASPPAQMDLILDGAADIAFLFQPRLLKYPDTKVTRKHPPSRIGGFTMRC